MKSSVGGVIVVFDSLYSDTLMIRLPGDYLEFRLIFPQDLVSLVHQRRSDVQMHS